MTPGPSRAGQRFEVLKARLDVEDEIQSAGESKRTDALIGEHATARDVHAYLIGTCAAEHRRRG